MLWPPLCIDGNKARGGLVRSSIVKMAGSSPGEAISETHLSMGKARGISTELPNQELGPCEGILTRGPMRTRRKRGASRYLDKNTIDGSLHLYLNQASAFTLCT